MLTVNNKALINRYKRKSETNFAEFKKLFTDQRLFNLKLTEDGVDLASSSCNSANSSFITEDSDDLLSSQSETNQDTEQDLMVKN